MDTVEQKYRDWFYWNQFTDIHEQTIIKFKKKLKNKDKYITLSRYSHIFDRDNGKALKNVLTGILERGPVRLHKTLLNKQKRSYLNPFLDFMLQEFPEDKLTFKSNRKKKNVEMNLDYISTRKKINISHYGNITGIMHDAFRGITDLLTEEIIFFSKNKTLNRIGKLKIASEELVYLRRRNMVIPIKHINLMFFLFSHHIEFLRLLALVMYDYISYFSTFNIHLHIHIISYPLLQYSLTSEYKKLKNTFKVLWNHYTLNKNRDIKDYFTSDNEGDYKNADVTGNLVRNVLLSKFTYLFSYIPILGFNTYLNDWFNNIILSDLQRVFMSRLKDSNILTQGGDSYCVNQFIYFIPPLANEAERKYYTAFHKEFNFGVLNYSREDLFPLQQTGSCFMVEFQKNSFTLYDREFSAQTALKNKNRNQLRNKFLKAIIKIFEPGVE